MYWVQWRGNCFIISNCSTLIGSKACFGPLQFHDGRTFVVVAFLPNLPNTIHALATGQEQNLVVRIYTCCPHQRPVQAPLVILSQSPVTFHHVALTSAAVSPERVNILCCIFESKHQQLGNTSRVRETLYACECKWRRVEQTTVTLRLKKDLLHTSSKIPFHVLSTGMGTWHINPLADCQVVTLVC